MTIAAIDPALPTHRAPLHRAGRIDVSALAVVLALMTTPLATLPTPASAADQAGGGGEGEAQLRSMADLARAPRELGLRGPSPQQRLATTFSSTVTPNDSFLVMSHGFDDLISGCQPRGWTGTDLTTAVFGHVTNRFTINDGFVNMGTRSFWFGADSSSALAEIRDWVQPYGYANGWSQRLTSPAFSRTANPAAVLRFDVSMELDRSLDIPATGTFTPFGLASGKVANDMLAVEGLLANGSWAFLNGRFSLAGGPASWEQTPPLFVNRYGIASGAFPPTLAAPNGIATDDSGNVYVADRGNDRVLKFTGAGRFLSTWGTSGAGVGQFTSPFDVHVDAAFNVYVVDATNRVQKFTNAGTFLTQWGGTGSGPGQFNTPLGVATDAGGNVYVADGSNNRVQKFTPNGVFITQWGSTGSGPGQFNNPSGIAVDAAGSVYVTDVVNNRVEKFTNTGAFILQWGLIGAAPGQFNAPAGIAVDRDGFVWVVDRNNSRIQRFTNTGGSLMATGSFGGGGGHFFSVPRDIAINRRGDVYVVESGNNRFQSFAIGGPIAGENTFKYEVRINADGNQDLSLASSLRLRLVMQTSLRSSPADGTLIPGQHGVVLVDNLTITNTGGGNVVAPVDFETGTTGGWTVSALNGGYLNLGNVQSAIRDFAPPATNVALRSGFDLYDGTCAWTFLSPGDTLANGTFARIASPWIGLVPGRAEYALQATARLNTLRQSRFVSFYTRGKNSGDTHPITNQFSGFVYYGTDDPDESAAPLEHSLFLDYPAGAASTPVNTDSIQIVIEVLDQPERLLGTLPQQRPTAHLPILDDIEIIQLAVDSDFDGVASVVDACSTSCAAGQDANGDGCVDADATLHHVESWPAGTPIHYAISSAGSAPNLIASTDGGRRATLAAAAPFSTVELAAIRDGFLQWTTVDGASLPLVEDPAVAQTDASALDGLNIVTRQDPDVEFPLGVLAITPTTSFTRRSAFGDRIVLPGQIVDSDMIISPNAPFTTTGEANKFDLESVVTHEAGHMLGLSHSGVLDATMFFVLQPGEDARSLTDDDRSAIAAAYPAPNLGTDYGTIQGVAFHGQDGEPLPGALIEAVRIGASEELADTTASDYTAEDGSYALRRLPPGDYSVRITPLDGNVGGFPLTPAHISDRLRDIAQTTVFLPEWWSSPETARDDPSIRDVLTVGAGQILTGINIITTVDTIPPYIASMLPADGAAGVGVDSPLLVNFSEPVTPASLEASFRLRKDGQPPSISGTGQLLRGMNFVYTPTAALEFDSSYELEISPALQDLENVALADTFRAVFRTQPQPGLSIADIQPRSAPIGALITITGTGFNANSLVSFSISSLCSSFLVSGSNVTPTSMVVRLPACVISGHVNIVTLLGDISNPFDLTILPPAAQVAPTPSGAPVALNGISPTDAAVSPDGGTAFVAGDGGFASVDLNAPGRLVTQHLTGIYRGAALTPDGNRVITCGAGTGEVFVLGATPGTNMGAVLAELSVSGYAGGVAISPNGRRAYVVDKFIGMVHEIDIDPASPAAYTLRREIPLPGTTLSGGLTVSLDGNKLFLASPNRGLISADLSTTPATVTVLNPSQSDGGVAIVPSGGEVLAPGANFNSSLVFSTLPDQGFPTTGAVFIGGAPRDVAITPEGQSALVVSSQTNELRVIDVSPGSATYHSTSSVVGTGQTPVSVGVSSLSPVVAVANYGDRTLSIYATNGASGAVERVVPDVALPGDVAAVHSADDMYTAGSQVDLATGAFPVTRAIGTAVAFAVPNPTPQRATTLMLQSPNGGRSLPLPFQIVDPITTFAPRATGLTGTVPSDFCDLPNPEQGRIDRILLSPDGKLLAMARTLSSGCYFVDFARASADGSQRPGEFLISFSSFTPIIDMAFTPDSKQLWAARGSSGSFRLDADPTSVTFGQAIGNLVSGLVGHAPNTVAADPLNRYMLVTSSDPSVGATVDLYSTIGGVQDTTYTDESYIVTAVSRDGRYAVLGGGAGARFYSLETGNYLPTPPQDPGIDNVLELALTTDGKRAVGLLGGSNIAVWNLDPAAGAIGANLYFGHPIAASLRQLIPGSDGHSALVACTNCNTLYKLDVSTVPPTVTSADVGQPFTALTRSEDGRRLWGVNSVPVPGSGFFQGDLQLFSLADAANLTLVTGGGQSGLPQTTLPVPIRARVTGADGRPQEGVVIRFSANGVLDLATGVSTLERISDVNGEAAVNWTLPNPISAALMTITALGGPAAPLSVPAQIVFSDAEIIPAVTLFGPLNGATDVNAGSAVFARFNQRMNPDSLPAYLHLVRSGANVAGSLALQEGGRVAVFQPGAALPFGSSCTLIVDAGALDTDGQRTVSPQQSAFTIQTPPTLALASLTPPAAVGGATVVIAGEGFSLTPSNNIVLFSGVLAPVQRASLTSLVVAVPANATSGPVTVQVGGNTSPPLTFTVLTASPDPGQVVGEVPDNQGVSRVVFTPDGSRAYVTNPARNSVTVLDITTATVITSISVGLTPKGIAVLPDGSRVYVANSGSDDVSVIDSKVGSPAYNTVVKTITVGDEPVDVATTGGGPRVYVANSASGTISVIDANPGNGTFDQVVTTINTGSGSGAVTITPDETRMYVGTGTGVVYVDLSSLVVTTINTGSGCGSITVSPDETIVLALLFNGTLVVIDATPGSATFNQVVTTINTGSGASGVTISPDETLAYVTSADGNVLAVYQIITINGQSASSTAPGPPITLTLVATLPVGTAPADVAIDPTGSGLALVTNAGSGTISFVGFHFGQPPVVIDFELKPDHLRLGCWGGKWVTGYLDPPEPFGPADIDVSSILLNGVLPVDRYAPVQTVDDDHDDEYIPEAEIEGGGHHHHDHHHRRLKVKWLRTSVLMLLPIGDHVPVVVTGRMLDRTFVGYDTVKVKRGRVHHPHQDQVVDPMQPCAAEWDVSHDDHASWVALMHSFDHGVTWQLDASHLPNNGHAAWDPPDIVADSVKLAVVEVEYSAPGDTVISGVFGVSDYFRLLTATAVGEIPVRLEFSPISPRPSHGAARMRFGLPRGADVDLEVFDVQGRRVRTLVSGPQEPGWHEATWDGSTDGGGRAGTGLYYARLRAEGRTFHQRVVWLR